jgi:hypothetical protein
MVSFGQVRALMRQDCIQLAAVETGQRAGDDHDPAVAWQAVHGGTVVVDDPDICGGSRPGYDGQDIIVSCASAPGRRRRRTVYARHAAQDRHREQASGYPGCGPGRGGVLSPQHGRVGADLSARDGRDQPGHGRGNDGGKRGGQPGRDAHAGNVLRPRRRDSNRDPAVGTAAA